MPSKHFFSTNKRRSTLFAILALVLIVGAYFVAVRFWGDSNKNGFALDGDSVGICVHSLSADDARLVNDSGARWVRIDVSPDFGEAVKNARAYNLSVLGILDSWMFDKSTTFTLEEWGGNVTKYVSQYADSVDAWEIWNEPASTAYSLLNLDPTYAENMSRISDFYFSMAQTASPIIRQFDPTAKILLFGGLQLWSGNATQLALDKNFASQLAAKNIQQFGDAISVHAYPCMDKVESWIWKEYNDSLTHYRSLFPTLDVWVTETGQFKQADGEAPQAQYLTDAFQFFQGKAARVFWYSLHDNSWETDQGFGLQENVNSRPAYVALQNITDR